MKKNKNQIKFSKNMYLKFEFGYLVNRLGTIIKFK